jgi:hypothetical protein
MAWFAITNTLSGELVSIASVLADPLPVGLIALLQVTEPDLRASQWNSSLRLFEARPAKVLIDRWNDLLTDPNYVDFQTVYNGLNTANKTRLRTMLQRVFGNMRFRNASEGIEL